MIELLNHKGGTRFPSYEELANSHQAVIPQEQYSAAAQYGGIWELEWIKVSLYFPFLDHSVIRFDS